MFLALISVNRINFQISMGVGVRKKAAGHECTLLPTFVCRGLERFT